MWTILKIMCGYYENEMRKAENVVQYDVSFCLRLIANCYFETAKKDLICLPRLQAILKNKNTNNILYVESVGAFCVKWCIRL